PCGSELTHPAERHAARGRGGAALRRHVLVRCGRHRSARSSLHGRQCMSAARIELPSLIRRGDAVEVRIVIQHPMETGFRIDAWGKRVPRNAIHSLTCRYNGVEVFRATLGTGIAANPYLRFFTRAVDSGELAFWWLDDDEVQGSAKATISVA